MDYEYPVILRPKEEVKFVIENFMESHVEFTVKKCDQSNPFIFYTNDEEEFQKDLFSNFDKFGNSNIFRHISRTKEKGMLYIKIKGDPKEISMLLVKGNYAMNPGENFVDLDAGNMGMISYQFESLK